MPNGACKNQSLETCINERLFASRFASVVSLMLTLVILFILFPENFKFSDTNIIRFYAMAIFAINIIYYFLGVYHIEDRMLDLLSKLNPSERFFEWAVRVFILTCIYVFCLCIPILDNENSRKTFILVMVVAMYLGYFTWDIIAVKITGKLFHTFVIADILTAIGTSGLVTVLLVLDTTETKEIRGFVTAMSGVCYFGAFAWFFLANNKAGWNWICEHHSRLG